MKNEFLNAYSATVTANGMFQGISSIPLHQSYSGYSPIDSVYSMKMDITESERTDYHNIQKYNNFMKKATFLGVRATNELAGAFEKDTISELKSHELMQKTCGELFELCTIDELDDLIKIAELHKKAKEK